MRELGGLEEPSAPKQHLRAREAEQRPGLGGGADRVEPALNRLEPARREQAVRERDQEVCGGLQEPGIDGELERLFGVTHCMRAFDRPFDQAAFLLRPLFGELAHEEVAEQRMESESASGRLVEEALGLQTLERPLDSAQLEGVGGGMRVDAARHRGREHDRLDVRRLAPEDLLREVTVERVGHPGTTRRRGRGEPGEPDHRRPSLRPLDQRLDARRVAEHGRSLFAGHREVVAADLRHLAVEHAARGRPARSPARGRE